MNTTNELSEAFEAFWTSVESMALRAGIDGPSLRLLATLAFVRGAEHGVNKMHSAIGAAAAVEIARRAGC